MVALSCSWPSQSMVAQCMERLGTRRARHCTEPFGDRGPLINFSVGQAYICADLGFRPFPLCHVSPSSLQLSLCITPGRRARVADGQGRPAPPPDLEGEMYSREYGEDKYVVVSGPERESIP